MSILLSDEELDALRGLTDFQFRLYVQGIRRHMDYKTGVVGIKRKISYQSLVEDTYTEPGNGIQCSGSKSKSQAKRAVKILEKNGLIVFKSIVTKSDKSLILSCILAKTEKSVQNKPVPPPYHSPVPQAVPHKTSENTINKAVSDTSSKQSVPQPSIPNLVKAVRPQRSENIINNEYIINNNKAKKIIEKIELPSWLDEKDWNDFLQHRKDMKAKMSIVAQTRAIRELEKLRSAGNDVKDVINQSIVRGWKGLFGVKTNGGFKNGTHKESNAELNFRLNTRILRRENPEMFESEDPFAPTFGAPGATIDGEIISSASNNL